MGAFNKLPSGTWIRACEIYKEKYIQHEKKEDTIITPNLIRSRFYNCFNIYVIKAVEEAARMIRDERDKALMLKNEILNKHLTI